MPCYELREASSDQNFFSQPRNRSRSLKNELFDNRQLKGRVCKMNKRDFVVQDLLQFFKSRCGNPGLIKDRNTDVRHYCGYDQNLPGWRLLADTISMLPHVRSYGYWLAPTEMGRLSTIKQIADKLISKRASKTPSPRIRTGRAKFLAVKER